MYRRKLVPESNTRKKKNVSFNTEALAERLAKDYANYANVELSPEMKILNDTILDIMMHLEEFHSIIQMFQYDSAQCMVPKLQSMQQEITHLCKRINALEQVIATANANLTTLEAAVENAEAELGISHSLFGKFNPLSLFKKNQEPIASNKISEYDPPLIYSTSDYFKTE